MKEIEGKRGRPIEELLILSPEETELRDTARMAWVYTRLSGFLSDPTLPEEKRIKYTHAQAGVEKLFTTSDRQALEKYYQSLQDDLSA